MRPKDPNKTKKIRTVPIAEDGSSQIPGPPSQTAQPAALGTPGTANAHPSQGRISTYGPPSSDAWTTDGEVLTERNTEPTLTVPATNETETATLTVITGFNAGQVFMLERDEATVGRGNDTSIPVEDAGVSRAHARFLKRGETWFIEDLASTNGSFVSATRVRKSMALTRGDRIQLGPNLMLRFDVTDRAEAELSHQLYESSTRRRPHARLQPKIFDGAAQLRRWRTRAGTA